MYDHENMATIKRELGKGSANSGDGTKALQQGVATMQHLRHYFRREVTVRS